MTRTRTLGALSGAALWCMAWESFPAGSAGVARQSVSASATGISGEAAAQVHCRTCHGVPPPDALPRSAWRDEIARMFLIQANQPEPAGPRGTAARLVALPAEWQSIVRYYEANAPELLAPLAPWPPPDRVVAFRKRLVTGSGVLHHAVANVRFVDIDHDERLEIVLSDMRNGAVFKVRPQDDRPALTEIARLSNPTHIEPVDVDRDGVLDLLVGDLGRFAPSDHRSGAVVLLRGHKEGTYSPVRLDGWPRVSDVRAADFDGDGRLDLAVAAFGWRRSGNVAILRNETTDPGKPSFVPHRIDDRTGAIHSIPVDLNGDAKPDLLTLFAQEHEAVVAFVNQGDLRFAPHVIDAAPHPGWGSSGIQAVDLDGDGDLDVLATNGDTFDDAMVKPYHGIRWLENTGTFPFTPRLLAPLGAVSRAQAADLDGDGDLDVVACALLASPGMTTADLPSLVWLEQTRRGVFERHVLEMGVPAHATLDTGDFDGDGDADIVVGNFTFGVPAAEVVTIFENLRVLR